MMCYKDMTFCSYHEDCSTGEDCDRALTPKVIESAEKWMKNAPICQYADKPKCFKEAI